MPVGRVHQQPPDDQEDDDRQDLHRHHDVVGLRRLLDPADQEHGEDEDDQEGREVEVGAGQVPGLPKPGSTTCPAG